MSTFNEDSRVKIPALLHLVRLGYRHSNPLPQAGGGVIQEDELP
jgi:hypothetical protein